MKKYGAGGGAFEGKTLYFCGGGGREGGCGWGVRLLLFFFSIQWQLVFVKMYNFLQVMVLLKNAVCSNGICWNEKNSSYF